MRSVPAIAARVVALKPGPPRTVTTTLRSAQPALEISPAVEQPISGTPPVCSRIPASSSRSS
jgi:hypothetical protein